jgi:hypothetical protein
MSERAGKHQFNQTKVNKNWLIRMFWHTGFSDFETKAKD